MNRKGAKDAKAAIAKAIAIQRRDAKTQSHRCHRTEKPQITQIDADDSSQPSQGLSGYRSRRFRWLDTSLL